MSTWHFGNRSYQVPGSWNELSRTQLIKIAGILHAKTTTDIAMFKIIMILLEIRKRWKLAWTLLFKISWEEKVDHLADLRLFAEFIFKSENIDLTEQLIPKVRAGFEVLYGPPSKCSKMVFLEFIKAETYYLKFRNNFANQPARMDSLNKLVSVLYRHKQIVKDQASWNGDIREIYNDNTVTHRALKVVSLIPDNVKYAILLFYDGCRKIRIARFKHVFEGGSNTSKGGTWIDALRNMAGGARHMEELGNVDVDLALYDLNKIIEESNKKKSK